MPVGLYIPQTDTVHRAATVLYMVHRAATVLYMVHRAAMVLYMVHRAAMVLYMAHRAATVLYMVHRAATVLYTAHRAATVLYMVHRAATVLYMVHRAATVLYTAHRAATVLYMVHRAATVLCRIKIKHQQQVLKYHLYSQTQTYSVHTKMPFTGTQKRRQARVICILCTYTRIPSFHVCIFTVGAAVVCTNKHEHPSNTSHGKSTAS
jgi:hypothetical protein